MLEVCSCYFLLSLEDLRRFNKHINVLRLQVGYSELVYEDFFESLDSNFISLIRPLVWIEEDVENNVKVSFHVCKLNSNFRDYLSLDFFSRPQVHSRLEEALLISFLDFN